MLSLLPELLPEPTVSKVKKTVFYAPTKNRHYFTLASAVHNEAKARLLEDYPSDFSQWKNVRDTKHYEPKQKQYDKLLDEYSIKVKAEYDAIQG